MMAEHVGTIPTPSVDGLAASMTVPMWWSQLVARRPETTALLSHATSHTLADIDRRSANIAVAMLEAGYGKGSRIALLMSNGPDWIAVWLATQRIGAVAVLLSTFFAAEELHYALRHSDAGLLILDQYWQGQPFAERLEAALPALTAADGQSALLIDSAPYLRRIWSADPAHYRWVARTLVDAECCGASIAKQLPSLLTQVANDIVAADLSSIIYTSGSTALPKAVVHRQNVMTDKITYLAANNAVIPCETGLGDVVLVTMPLFWVGGFLSCFGALECGAAVVFAKPLPAAQLWSLIEEFGATHVTGSDAVLRSLQDHMGPSQPLSDLLRPQNSNQTAWFRARQGFDSASIGSAFGMTETMGPHSGFHGIADTYGGQAGSVGLSLPGVARRIVDPETRRPLPKGETGELLVRGRWMMEGYYKVPRTNCFDAEGYFPTGDICRIDELGRLHFIGRANGMIKTSGANVSPEEVEAVLRQRDEVIEAVVLGIADEVRGQLVVAVLALRPGATVEAAALRHWLEPKLSKFKIPREFLFQPLDAMPRTSSNKIHRGDLARMVSDGSLAALGRVIA